MSDTALNPLASLPRIASRILIVDDTPHILQILEDKLKREGYEVRTAATGLDVGLQATQFRPDLIILDIMLPGIDGVEVLKRLRSEETTRGIKVIGMSATSDQALIQKLRDAGAEDFMAKPFKLAEIPDRVRRQIGPIRPDTSRLENNRLLVVAEPSDALTRGLDALRRAGYLVEQDRSLAAAGFRLGPFRPDAILLDGALGASAVKTLAGRLPELRRSLPPVLIAIAEGDPAAFRESGARDVIPSGTDPAALPARIAATLGPVRRSTAAAPGKPIAKPGHIAILLAGVVLLAAGALWRGRAADVPPTAPAPPVPPHPGGPAATTPEGGWRIEEMSARSNGLLYYEGNWFAASLLGRGEIVTLKDGRMIEGLVGENPRGELLWRSGRDVKIIAPGDVASRTPKRHPYEDYWEKSAATKASDAAALAALARWCESARLPLAAQREWRRVLIADPANTGAKKALDVR